MSLDLIKLTPKRVYLFAKVVLILFKRFLVAGLERWFSGQRVLSCKGEEQEWILLPRIDEKPHKIACIWHPSALWGERR